MPFDPHAEVQLVRPNVTAEDALHVAKTSYELDGSVKELGSNQDRNYLLTPSGWGEARYLLKFDNDAFPLRELEVQNEAVLRLSAAGIPVPAPVRDVHGEWVTTATTLGGRRVRARLLSFVEGESLVDDGYLSPVVIAGIGDLAGRVVRELATLVDPALDRDLQWDMRNAMAVIEAYAPEIAPERRERVLAASRVAWETVQALAPKLPVQAIHGDITDDNTVGKRDTLGRVRPAAVIDWGDLSTGWRVAEIAVTVSSLLHHQRGAALDALPAIAAFDAHAHLSDAEIGALWPLVVLRGAVVAVSGAHQLALDPANAYVADRLVHEWRIFETAESLHPALAVAVIQAGLGRESPSPPAPLHPLILGLADQAEAVRLDTASPNLHRGVFADPDIEARLASEAVQRGRVAVFAYGEHRLTRAPPPGPEVTATAALFTELRLPQAADIHAPFAGDVVSVPDGVIVHGEFGAIELRGAEPALGTEAACDPGAVIATLSADTPLLVRWHLPSSPPAPLFSTAAELPAWRRLTADPSQLLGLPPATWLPSPEAERERRMRAVPGAAERYYETPPEIERGWRELLFDTTGRAYIDMVNNVAGIGHAHPAMADAVQQQLLTLNTNNRFLYSSLATYVERLAALAPDPSLSAVLLVNSGSEAVDLALRLSHAHTRRRDVVCLREAYHGWTAASDAVSTSDWDNPGAQASRPAWVHVAGAVNTYRGKHRGMTPECGKAYAADLDELLCTLESEGTPAGAFIAESVFGNGGGVMYPPGYLPAAYAAVRARGGLCIADEVQVGLGRLGHATWGVQTQGAVPDILVVAKALGNGYPLGAVYTTKEIAASLEREGMFFSSAGGATASAVAGLAVLDVMAAEGLQANAASVGDHLAARFHALAERFPIIGHVHGMGLYQGVELVLDRNPDSLEPAIQETEWVCERLLAYGIIMQPTSERRNVLKIKPPLTLTRAHADIFVDALEAVLTELEARTRHK
jgi:4-aminobutyrate aminotransferase-like enzyme/Ser/Thr protein kinase RdoA (MazF antagonist)